MENEINMSSSVLFYEKGTSMKCAVYSGTRNLYSDMLPAVKSMLANSDVDKIYLMIEDAEFPYELPSCIECIDVHDQQFFPEGSPNMKSPFSYMSLMRAALALMPEFAHLDKILSMDVDTVCVRDMSDIWDMPIEDCYFSASREDGSCYKGMLYCNTGVTLYNLEKLRDGKAQEVIDALNWRRYDNIEQDVFSFMCQGHIHDMPSEYNATSYTDPCHNPRIVHYAGKKEWSGKPEVIRYRDRPWKEVMRLRKW